MYQLQQLDISEEEKQNDFWHDQIKLLPDGNLMTLKEILTALDGGDFMFYPDYFEKGEKVIGFNKEERDYYFTVFHNTEEFGLPHGQGWLNELSWTIQFLTQMRYIKKIIQIDQQTKLTSNDEINPQAFGGY